MQKCVPCALHLYADHKFAVNGARDGSELPRLRVFLSYWMQEGSPSYSVALLTSVGKCGFNSLKSLWNFTSQRNANPETGHVFKLMFFPLPYRVVNPVI